MRRLSPVLREAAKKRLHHWEEHIGKYGERLIDSATKPTPEPKVVDQIRHLLDTRMESHSSRPQLQQHFSELFNGLEALTSPERSRRLVEGARTSNERLVLVLARDRSASQILTDFDEVYFHGLADFAFTTKVLADSRIDGVQHFVRAVAGGGTILRWSGTEKVLFGLHVANKLWKLNRREEASAWITRAWETELPERLSSGDLDAAAVKRAVQAGLIGAPHAVLQSLPIVGARGAYAIWLQSRMKPSLCDITDKAAGVVGLADSLAQVPLPTPDALEFIPSRRHPELQIINALVRYGIEVGEPTVAPSLD